MATGLAEQVNENEWVRFPFPVGVFNKSHADLSPALLLADTDADLLRKEGGENSLCFCFGSDVTAQSASASPSVLSTGDLR